MALSDSRATKVQSPSPAALPRQQVKTPLLWSEAKSTTAVEVSRQRRMLFASEVAARPVVETVPTVEFDIPSVVMVAPDDGSQFAGRTSLRCGCSDKSRPFARMGSSQGRPARVRAQSGSRAASGTSSPTRSG